MKLSTLTIEYETKGAEQAPKKIPINQPHDSGVALIILWNAVIVHRLRENEG